VASLDFLDHVRMTRARTMIGTLPLSLRRDPEAQFVRHQAAFLGSSLCQSGK
jgi:hypothetical protein